LPSADEARAIFFLENGDQSITIGRLDGVMNMLKVTLGEIFREARQRAGVHLMKNALGFSRRLRD
jgi:hypothetical protein